MKKPSGKSGRRHLDDDESADWDYAARSVEPLKRSKGRVGAHGAVAASAAVGRPRQPASPDSAGPVVQKAPVGPAAPAKPRKTPIEIAVVDRKKLKRLRSGRIEIEARIDLHGMRQDEAHTALCAFILRAQSRGLRWVLVITGKGATGAGVLKRNVPRWLEEPELRALIVSYSAAAIPHGGDGALYVHLRKKPA